MQCLKAAIPEVVGGDRGDRQNAENR